MHGALQARANRSRWPVKSASPPKMTASTRCWAKLAKTELKSRSLLAFAMRICSARARAAVCASLIWASAAGFSG